MATYIRVTPADRTLFHVAARELGDATQWVRIAELNSLTDPTINFSGQIEIPAIDTTSSGGVAATADTTDGGDN